MHFKLAQKRIEKREGGGLQSSIFSGGGDFLREAVSCRILI
jgi:hypothetical protein